MNKTVVLTLTATLLLYTRVAHAEVCLPSDKDGNVYLELQMEEESPPEDSQCRKLKGVKVCGA